MSTALVLLRDTPDVYIFTALAIYYTKIGEYSKSFGYRFLAVWTKEYKVLPDPRFPSRLFND